MSFSWDESVVEKIMPVTGFIIESIDGSFLDSGFHWSNCKNQSETFVHSEEEIGNILFLAQDWEIKPMHLYPAQYDPNAKKEYSVTLLSERPIGVVFPQ